MRENCVEANWIESTWKVNFFLCVPLSTWHRQINSKFNKIHRWLRERQTVNERRANSEERGATNDRRGSESIINERWNLGKFDLFQMEATFINILLDIVNHIIELSTRSSSFNLLPSSIITCKFYYTFKHFNKMFITSNTLWQKNKIKLKPLHNHLDNADVTLISKCLNWFNWMGAGDRWISAASNDNKKCFDCIQAINHRIPLSIHHRSFSNIDSMHFN